MSQEFENVSFPSRFLTTVYENFFEGVLVTIRTGLPSLK